MWSYETTKVLSWHLCLNWYPCLMVIEVETLAVRRALELALELGFDNIVLEGDLEVSHQSPKERHQFFGSVWTYCKCYSHSCLVFFSFQTISCT